MDITFSPVSQPHVMDYVVIGIFLFICMGIGVYYGYQTDKQKTLENYFLGNRRLSLVPVSLSLFVTFASAISLMGVPAEVYVYGIRVIYVAISFLLSLIIASVTIVPLLYPLRITSTYEYLELRFKSKGVRTLGTLIGMLQTLSITTTGNSRENGSCSINGRLFHHGVAGIPLWVSIVVIGLIGTIYTAIGGIKSVVWTDTFQCIMIFIGLAAISIKGRMNIGKDYSIFQIAERGSRLEFSNFDPDPRVRHTVWGICIGLTFSFLPNWCNQSSIQRVSSLRTVRAAKLAFWLLVPVEIAYIVILGYLGILLYSYYNVLACDPVQAEFLPNQNQLMPFFVLDVFRSLPGLSGIYISCLFSGALSTISSGINALSANTIEDILSKWLKKIENDFSYSSGKIVCFVGLIISYLMMKVFSYGLVVVGLAYGINFMSGSIVQMALSVFGACGGPLAGLFFLGGLVPKANWIGAMVGSISALVFNLWITIGSQMYGRKPEKLPPNPSNGCYVSNVTYNVLSYNSSTSVDTLFNVEETTMETKSTISTENYFFLYNISYTWYGFIGVILTLFIGTLISYCTGFNSGEPVEARLLFPFCRKLYGLESTHTYTEEMIEQKNVLYPDTTENSHSNSKLSEEKSHCLP